MSVKEPLPHVLILSLVFPPDNVSTAQIMGELAQGLVSLGHEVTVLTTMPHYNPDPLAESRQPISQVWGPFLSTSQFTGAVVYHTLMPKKTTSKIKRLLAWGIFHFISIIAGLWLRSSPDVIISPSPPLTIGLEAWLIGRSRGIPVIYNVQELFPDLAVQVGVIRSTWLLRLLYNLEHFIYKKVERITVISPGIGQRIKAKGVPEERIVYIPNWVDLDHLRPLPKKNDFSRAHGLQDCFVVGYAGNVGLAQDFEDLIEAACILRHHNGVRFLIVGSGVARRSLQSSVEALGLKNVSLLPHQPYKLMPEIYASTDLSVTPLHRQLTAEAMPSKVYRIMACGRPVLAIANGRSDLAHLVRDTGCGVVVAPGNSQALVQEVVAASEDPDRLVKMGQAGRQYVETHCAREDVVERYSRELREVARQRGRNKI